MTEGAWGDLDLPHTTSCHCCWWWRGEQRGERCEVGSSNRRGQLLGSCPALPVPLRFLWVSCPLAWIVHLLFCHHATVHRVAYWWLHKLQHDNIPTILLYTKINTCQWSLHMRISCYTVPHVNQRRGCHVHFQSVLGQPLHWASVTRHMSGCAASS